MKKENGAWFHELLDSIQFYFDSRKGKFSLETYLDIIGEYTDRLIYSAQNEGLRYLGGECKVKKSLTKTECLNFEIEMFFRDVNNIAVTKKSSRELECRRFTKDALKKIGNGILQFSIEQPKTQK